ncbi:hypothetical protein [Bythopirellula polymerisocia]|uniref:Uncharacterized protein n=1 Tax=Bythopirellula polymerisocia TaxID=2528003 RepID=A0A5C6CVD5_9BACT|nr:hypothetical protein [Bythopirellula polymerisocia]TWU28550.1 hypothetical protein Pla144_18410 [Bythopirellula polymerisocia]
MNLEHNNSTEVMWQLRGHDALLKTGSFSAHLNLQRPVLGLRTISAESVSLTGSVLGIGLAQGFSEQGLSINEGFDCFVRGRDLVARYPETHSQPFSLDVYWRVEITDSRLVIIDAIVSLQTSLLESYPKVQTITSIHAKEAWFVPDSHKKARLISSGQELTCDEFAGVLLRGAKGSWSYLEMTHPEDLGTWQAVDDQSDSWTLQRTLGGEFQEKGVIRRLRVRGLFIPREGDIETAPRLLKDFASSLPPLTA